jgi:hypothetical protein
MASYFKVPRGALRKSCGNSRFSDLCLSSTAAAKRDVVWTDLANGLH